MSLQLLIILLQILTVMSIIALTYTLEQKAKRIASEIFPLSRDYKTTISIFYNGGKSHIIKPDKTETASKKEFLINTTPAVHIDSICSVILTKDYYFFVFNTFIPIQNHSITSFSLVGKPKEYMVIYSTAKPPTDEIRVNSLIVEVRSCSDYKENTIMKKGLPGAKLEGVACMFISTSLDHICIALDSYHKELILFVNYMTDMILKHRGADYRISIIPSLRNLNLFFKNSLHINPFPEDKLIYYGQEITGEVYVGIVGYQSSDDLFRTNPMIKVLSDCIFEVYYATLNPKSNSNNEVIICCPTSRSIKCNTVKLNIDIFTIDALYLTELSWAGEKRAANHLTIEIPSLKFSMYIVEIYASVDPTKDGTYIYYYDEVQCPVYNKVLISFTEESVSFILDTITYDVDYYSIVFLELFEPKIGFIRSNGVNVVISTPYEPNNMLIIGQYGGNTTAKYYITHKMGIGSSDCTISLEVKVICHENCLTCTLENDNISMHCLTCKPGKSYNPRTENCITNLISHDGYYVGIYDEYYPCYSKCKICSKPGSLLAHNCIECLSTSELLMLSNGNCISSTAIPIPGYYADLTAQIIYPCYSSCELCNGIGLITNHYCTACKADYYMIPLTQNCYSIHNSPDNYFFNDTNPPVYWEECPIYCKSCQDKTKCFSCVPNAFLFRDLCHLHCPEGFSYYKASCMKHCLPTARLINDECVDLYIYKNDSSIVKETIMSQKELASHLVKNITDFAGDNTIIKGGDYVVQIYTPANKHKTDDIAKEFQLASVSVDACAKALSDYYNIQPDDIIIVQIDHNKTEDSNRPTNDVQLIYFDKNNKQINPSPCKDISLTVEYPIVDDSIVNITQATFVQNQGYDIFETNDPFFNSICTPFSSETNTDVTINSRRDDYFQNVTFCQEGCDYKGTNLTDLTAICECKLHKDKIIDEMIKDFQEALFTTNFWVIQCFSQVFDINIFYYNIGFYFISSFIFLELLLLIYMVAFAFKHFSLLLELPRNAPPHSNRRHSDKNTNTNDKNNDYDIESHKDQSEKHFNILSTKPKSVKSCNHMMFQSKTTRSNKKTSKFSNLPVVINNSNTNQNMIFNTETTIVNSSGNSNTDQTGNSNEKEIKTAIAELSNEENLTKFLRISLEAQKNFLVDKTHFFMVCNHFIKSRHPIWQTFISPDAYDLQVFNKIIFINVLLLDFSLNALFYTNDYIDHRYDNSGVFDFLFSLPKSIFSFLLGEIICYLLTFLTSSTRTVNDFINRQTRKKNRQIKRKETGTKSPIPTSSNQGFTPTMYHTQSSYKSNIISIHNQERNPRTFTYETCDMNDITLEEKKEYDAECKVIIKKIKIKISVYVIINFAMVMFLWYFTTAFCAIMGNSQVDWMIGCFISMGIGIIFYFILCMFFAILKWIAIRWRYSNLYVFIELVNIIL